MGPGRRSDWLRPWPGWVGFRAGHLGLRPAGWGSPARPASPAAAAPVSAGGSALVDSAPSILCQKADSVAGSGFLVMKPTRS